jgi:uncharacterized protein YjbI with pentapeptide repeats/beta-lactamase regulating signal transducer with metallopeptidase domain
MLREVVAIALHAIAVSLALGAALAALVFAATRLFALTASTRHVLWTTASIAIALMPLGAIGASLVKATPAHAHDVILIANPNTEAGPDARDTHAERALAAASQPGVSSQHGASQHHAAARPLPALPAVLTPSLSDNVALAIAVGWAIGACAGLIGLTLSVVRVRALKRRSSPLDGALADELPWLTALERGREIYLRLSFEIETPVAIGFRRPVILIPTELATADGLSAIESLVLHEHAHLRRYDDWTNLVQRIVERLLWFNPLLWFIGRRIALEREIASDDAVVERTGAPKEYATSLWRLAREMRMPEHAAVAPGALLTRKQISVRIEQLLDANRSRLRRSPGTALGVATAALFAVAFAATSSPAVELPTQTPVHHLIVVQALPSPSPSPTTLPSETPSEAPTEPTPVAPAPPPITPSSPRPTPHVSSRAVEAAKAQVEAAKAQAAAAARQTDAVHRMLSSRARYDGARVSRETLASCMGCSFRDADLHGLNLSGIALTGDDLRGANLSGANLSGAKLSGTSLRDANLRGANLAGAHLTGVELSGASLAGANLGGAHFVGISLHGVDLHGTMLRDVLGSCTGCDLSRLDLSGQDLHGIALTGVDLSHAVLRNANLHGAHLVGVNLSRADVAGADLSDAKLDGCDLSGVELKGARIEGMTMTGSDPSASALPSRLLAREPCEFAVRVRRGEPVQHLVAVHSRVVDS